MPRQPGTPNKATSRVRNAIALFADKHIDDFFLWLQEVAEEDKKAACDIYLKIIEYHIPKLQRTEGEITIKSDRAWLEQLNDPKVIEGDYEHE